ncbi:MAG: RNA polymerase sigma factor [Bdellovibrio sp.]|nr:RNA polymerase sigma factor [Bdellovibrio sp.]
MITDAQLVERLRIGDEEAFSLIYERYSETLLHHIFCMVGKLEVAEELLHEVFMTMLAKVNFYQENALLKNSFKAWLFRISTNRAIDEIRKHKNVKFEEPQCEKNDESDMESNFEKKWREHKVQEFLLKLPLGQRTFLNLKINNELSHFEIARICSCQVNTVKQGLFQARKSLKNMLVAEGVEL